MNDAASAFLGQESAPRRVVPGWEAAAAWPKRLRQCRKCGTIAAVDPLSDVLRAVRLSGAYFYLVEAGAPWSVAAMASRELVPHVMPGAEHLIPYHILTAGSCWGGVEGEPQVLMEPGDVIVFPQGDPHFMSSDRGRRVGQGTPGTAPQRFPEVLRLGPDGSRETAFVCGFLSFDVHPYNPLLSSLPRLIHAQRIADGWLAQFPRQAIAESRGGRVGSETMLTRLAELMFIEVLRRYVEELPSQQIGWLAGLRDPVVGQALAQLHERPAHPWTLAELAHAVAASRTVVAERFTRLVGLPPMTYLTQWRLQLAAERLASGAAKVATIADEVGYESEAAFSRAFKRATGTSPAAWRRARQGEPRGAAQVA